MATASPAGSPVPFTVVVNGTVMVPTPMPGPKIGDRARGAELPATRSMINRPLDFNGRLEVQAMLIANGRVVCNDPFELWATPRKAMSKKPAAKRTTPGMMDAPASNEPETGGGGKRKGKNKGSAAAPPTEVPSSTAAPEATAPVPAYFNVTLWVTLENPSGDRTPVSMSLGPIGSKPIRSGMLFPYFPASFQVEVTTDAAPVDHPSEVLLAQHCQALLDNDTHHGSVASSHLQNQVRELPFYPDVIESIRPSWNDFVFAHIPQLWNLVRYTQREVEESQLQRSCRANETRLVSLLHQRNYSTGDVARDRQKTSNEAELCRILKSLLTKNGPMEQSALLAEIIDEPAFLSTLTSNMTKILEQFEARPDKYFVTKSRLHPIAIEPRREMFVGLDTTPAGVAAMVQERRETQRVGPAIHLGDDTESTEAVGDEPDDEVTACMRKFNDSVVNTLRSRSGTSRGVSPASADSPVNTKEPAMTVKSKYQPLDVQPYHAKDHLT